MPYRAAGEITRTREVVQIFRATADYLSVIAPIFANYERIQTSRISLSLYQLPDGFLEKRPVSMPLSSWARRALYLRHLRDAWTQEPASLPRIVCSLGSHIVYSLGYHLVSWLGLRRTALARVVEARLHRLPAQAIAAALSASLTSRTPIAVLNESAAAVFDNSPFSMFFEPIASSAGRLFAIRIHSEDAYPNNAPTVWLDDGIKRIAGHVRCFVAGETQGDHGIAAELAFSPPTVDTPIPEHLLYSPVTQCNLNCVHCISRDTRKSVHRLPQSVKENIRSWCKKGLVKAITTDYSGDILWADFRFGGELEFLISLDVPIHIDTNGIHLTREVSSKLINSRVCGINISLDAAENETFLRIRKGARNISSVIANVAELVSIRRAAKAEKRVEISMGFTLMRSNLDQLEDFVRLAARIGVDKVAARHLEAYTSEMEGESLWFRQDQYNEIREKAMRCADQEGIVLSTERPFENRPGRWGHRYCTLPWTNSVILGNGDVQVCCVPKTKIGNLNEQTMEEIWNGSSYRAFRAAVNSPHPPAMCNACPMFRNPTNIYSYLPYRVMPNWVSPYDAGKSTTNLAHR